MRAMPGSNAKRPLRLPEVNFSDEGRVRHLHLGTEWIQGSMRLDAPTELFHEYIQRMMAWLLFVEPDSVAGRQALQLGLGAGSLSKFCYTKLHMQTAAIELNPPIAPASRWYWQTPPKKSKTRAGGAGWTLCKWICMTTRPQRQCWTVICSTATAAACSPTRVA